MEEKEGQCGKSNGLILVKRERSNDTMSVEEHADESICECVFVCVYFWVYPCALTEESSVDMVSNTQRSVSLYFLNLILSDFDNS